MKDDEPMPPPPTKEEITECQRIDADCNDCGYFKRGKVITKGSASVIEGTCLKTNEPTKAYPNFCSGHDCFVHRKDMHLE